MNSREHKDLKPHIESLCNHLGITLSELNAKKIGWQGDVTKQMVYSYLYFKVGVSYQNIANEFNVTAQNVSNLIQRADNRLRKNDPRHLEIQNKLTNFYLLNQ